MKAASKSQPAKRTRKSKAPKTFPQPSIDHWLDPGDEGKRLEVKDFLSMRFANLGALFHRKVTKHYLAPYGIGLPEWRTMTILAQHAPIATRALRDMSEMDKAQMSRALDTLAERGLIRRDSDVTHMVRQVIGFTEAGHALYRKIMPEARRSQAILLRSLTAAERKALHSALIKLRTVVDEMPDTE